jgi:uncharacterized protein (TIGR03083 family)
VEAERYLTLLEADSSRLLEAASKGLAAPVPSCPPWTVEDVLTHLARVYLHKVECMRQQRSPEPWPPDLSHREPIGLVRDSLGTLVGELRSRGPSAPSYTWYPPDQTVGFWYRRMAQETVIHRVDVELAHDCVTPVDPELAVDGVDEVLTIMLAGDWSDEPVDEAAGRSVVLTTGGRSWRVGLDRTQVEVVARPAGAAAPSADATVEGDPHDVLLWTWGRAPVERLAVTGDHGAVQALRRRLALATQ